MIETIIYGIIGTVCTLWIGGIQYQVRKMEKQLQETLSKKETKELIQDKLEVHNVRLMDLKEDLRDIIAKIDDIRESK